MSRCPAIALLCACLSLPAAADVLIRNVTIAGGAAGIDVLVTGKKIARVGKALAAGDASVIDGDGLIVTPGFIDSGTPLATAEVESPGVSSDRANRDFTLSAGFDIALALNPRSTLIAVAPGDGITMALVTPSPGSSIFTGQSAWLSTGTVRAVTPRVAVHVDLRERYRSLAGGSRGGALQFMLESLREAARYRRDRRDYDTTRARLFSSSRADLEALSRVLAREVPLVVAVDRASDIENVLRELDAFAVDVVIAHGAEAWKVAPAIAARNVPVVLNVLDNLPASFDALGARLDNAALLAEAGVRVALMSTEPYTNFRDIRQAAGVAVAYGLPWAEAIRTLTRYPASIWRLGDRGEIAPGKVADLVLWDGDPLEIASAPVRVMVDGDWVESANRQHLLRDRYKDLESKDVPFGYR